MEKPLLKRTVDALNNLNTLSNTKKEVRLGDLIQALIKIEVFLNGNLSETEPNTITKIVNRKIKAREEIIEKLNNII